MTQIKAFFRLMRLHRPIGIWLLLWPTLWALWIAARGVPPLYLLIIFVCGVVVMRSLGCIINDLADRHWDGAVERTKDRPLVTKAISIRAAIVGSLVLAFIAFALLLLLPEQARLWGLGGALIMVIYPFVKRFFDAPQLVLGLAFSWGIPMAFAAVRLSVPSVAMWLMAMTAVWIVAYDTAYAMADKVDDQKVGIRSTAIWWGRFDWIWVLGLEGLAWIGLLCLGDWLDLGWRFEIGMMLVLPFFFYQWRKLKTRDSSACIQAFRSNQWVGLVIFLSLAWAYLPVI